MLVRSVTVREPEWSPDDVAALLASRREQFAPRGSHGILISESTDPALKDAWEVDLPTRDFATALLHASQDTYFKQYPTAKGDSSLLWRVRRKE